MTLGITILRVVLNKVVMAENSKILKYKPTPGSEAVEITVMDQLPDGRVIFTIPGSNRQITESIRNLVQIF